MSTVRAPCRAPGEGTALTPRDQQPRSPWSPAHGCHADLRWAGYGTGLLPALLPEQQVDGWFPSGPYGLVECAERALRGLGVARSRMHEEIFHHSGKRGPQMALLEGGRVQGVTAAEKRPVCGDSRMGTVTWPSSVMRPKRRP